MKLLLIDDNRLLAWRLKNYLDSEYVVQAAHTAAEGITMAESENLDAVILDLDLPDKNGEDVCKSLRGRGINVPILVLTAEKNTQTTVRLLESGADDYLTKPFKIAELQARLVALIRRGNTKAMPKMLVVGDLTLNLENRRVSRANKEIKLRRKEFDILEYLALNRGRVLTRPMILDGVWQGETDKWNNTVDVHIKCLRDKVDRPFNKPLIKTAHGVGYMLDAK